MPDLCSILLLENLGRFNQQSVSAIICEQEREAIKADIFTKV